MAWPRSSRTPRARRLFTALAAAAASCSGPTPTSDQFPANLSITPNVGYPTEPVAAVITGTGFLVKASQPSGGGDPTFDDRHRAWLGTHELQVTWQGMTTLSATVPAGLEPGTYDLTVENALGNRGELGAAYTVLPAPVFSATAEVDHPIVNVGQPLTLTLTVTNNAPGDITGFALGTPTISSTDGGAASPSGEAPSAPSTIATGETRRFTWTYLPYAPPTTTAHIAITISVTGVDSISGEPVTATPPAPVTVTIQQSAALEASWAVSQDMQTVGEPITVTLQLANRSQASTARVTSVAPSFSPSTGASCTAPEPLPTPDDPAPVPGGEAQGFTWTCTASRFGSFTAGAAVVATDSNDGNEVPITGLEGIPVTYTQELVVGVTIAGNGKGSVSASPPGSPPPGISGCASKGAKGCSATFVSGSRISLTATPGAGSTVTWQGCESASGNVCTISSLAGPKNITATFTLATFRVTVTATGTGSGTVSSAPPGISCTVGSTSGCAGSFDYGKDVTLTAAPKAGSTVAWTGCDTSKGNTCTLRALKSSKDVKATFTLESRALTVKTTGNGSGTVTCNGGTCASRYDYGTVVKLAANPGTGSSFAGWSGDCSGSGACSVTMTASRSVTAAFTLKKVRLTVSPTGTGTGSVSSSPAGISKCTAGGGACSAEFDHGTAVKLTAAPGAGSTTSWTGCDSSSGNTCNLHALTAAKDVTVTFTLGSNDLSVTLSGKGTGAVTCNGAPCAQSYPYGTGVELAATPGTGSDFAGWSGDCSGTGACSVKMTATLSVTATFTIRKLTLTVNATGTGTGSVSSSPAGIDACAVGGGGTCSADFDYGTGVTLIAAPDAGSATTWAGCDAPDGDLCVINALTDARTVTATFTIQ